METDRLFHETYLELRRLAHAKLRGERREHTLQPTALVHEAYLRLSQQCSGSWQGRGHFLGIAARAMRQVLVDWARCRDSRKRGGVRRRVTLEDRHLRVLRSEPDILALDAAIETLAVTAPRQARLVELRLFGGLTVEELATALEVSRATVSREWRVARAWMAKLLAAEPRDAPSVP